jgi:hypothetical protein
MGPVVPPSDETFSLEGEQLAEAIKEWFFRNFEDPAESTSYITAEGGYQYIYGGPYEASEEIQDHFGETVDQKIIDAVVEEIEREGLEWAPHGNRIYDEDPPDDEEVGDEYAALQTSLNELEVVLDAIETVPSAIGGNNPPEDIGVPPYTDEDKAEIKASIVVLRLPETTLQFSEKAKALEAAEKIKSRAEKLGEFLKKHGDLAADAFSTELGKKSATVLVAGVSIAAVHIWPHLQSKLIAVYEAVQALFAF